MPLPCRAQELSAFPVPLIHYHSPSLPSTFLCKSQFPPILSLPMCSPSSAALSLLRSLAISLSHRHRHRHHDHRLIRAVISPLVPSRRRDVLCSFAASANSTLAGGEACATASSSDSEESWTISDVNEPGGFNFDKSFASLDLKHLGTPALEVKELDELPEQWRRSKLAWLCKELPAHKPATVVRLLNAQRKWMRQDDATYIAVHCMRIRENETAFRVYKWMMQQHWYHFDFAFASKLADYMGRERKFLKCREIFDDMINQGRVPSESTFHILIVAYLSSSGRGCLEEACNVYNRMIQLGGYQPRLSLHNSLFRALVSKPASSSKHYLKQAEYIYHNLVTTGLEIHKDIYGGLIWLHSYQDCIDGERISSLQEEMRQAGVEDGREVLLSILRVCAKEGDIKEAERTWLKLCSSDVGVPSQAYIYKMEAYAKVGNPMKSLEIFREMQQLLGSASVAAYHKIIEVLSKAKEVEFGESIMMEFIESGLKPLTPSYVDLMNMNLGLNFHDKLESAFSQCLERCRPDRSIYSIYLQSLVKLNNLERAEEIFCQMQSDATIGISALSCNIILSGYLLSGDYLKAEKIYDIMCQKKFDIDSQLMDKLDYVLSLTRTEVKKPISMKLSKEQRESLVGLLLGGLQIESDEERKNHRIRFIFNEASHSHSLLKRHIHEEFHEWLHSSSKCSSNDEEIPYELCTISHSYFGFYADQFWPRGHPVIPKLIHRWLSPRALAYWYMFGGHRTSSGDVLLKLKGSREGVEKVVKALKDKSLRCRVKRKGGCYWIGLLGDDSTWFSKLTEPYILPDLKDFLEAAGPMLENASMEAQNINFDRESDSDKEASINSDNGVS